MLTFRVMSFITSMSKPNFFTFSCGEERVVSALKYNEFSCDREKLACKTNSFPSV